MAKKSDKAEIDRRIHTVVKLLSSAKTTSYVCQYASDEWGVDRRTAERYLAKAREIIRADYSVERSDFLGTRLALLDEIIEASIRCKQHSNAVGAARSPVPFNNDFGVQIECDNRFAGSEAADAVIRVGQCWCSGFATQTDGRRCSPPRYPYEEIQRFGGMHPDCDQVTKRILCIHHYPSTKLRRHRSVYWQQQHHVNGF